MDVCEEIAALLGQEGHAMCQGDLIIRPASVKDVPALAQVHVESAEHHVGLDASFYVVPEEDAVRKYLKDRVAGEPADRALLVAELAGQVVGFVDLALVQATDPASMIRPGTAVTVGVAVLTARRRQGVGTRLMAAAEEWAVGRGATMIMLDMSAANRDALAFYGRLGYRTMGLLLRKRLGPVPN